MYDFKEWQYFNGHSDDKTLDRDYAAYRSENNATYEVYPYPHDKKHTTNLESCPAIWKQLKVRLQVFPKGFWAGSDLCIGDTSNTTDSENSDFKLDCDAKDTIGLTVMGINIGLVVGIYFLAFIRLYLKLPLVNKSKKALVVDWLKFVQYPVLNLVDSILGGIFIQSENNWISDVMYFVRMTTTLSIFWISTNIIKWLEVFIIASVFKDVILALVCVLVLNRDKFELSPHEQVTYKFIRLILGYILEDSGQNIIQYFFKEKYLMGADFFVYAKASIKIAATLHMAKLLGTGFSTECFF